MAEPQAQSKPLVERANTWMTALGAVISLVVGVTQQRPASTVALAIGVVVVLVGVVIFVTTAKAESGQPRFPVKVRRMALIASAGLTVIIATVFVVPASREAMGHNVLGFPSVAQEVRIIAVNVPQNDTAYQVKIIVLNTLRTEEWVHDLNLKLDRPCAPDAQPGHYTRPAPEPKPVGPPAPPTIATQATRKVAIALAMPTGGPSDDPNAHLTVTLLVGEPRTQVTHAGR